MSTAVLTLPVGAKFATRSNVWNTNVLRSMSDMETRIAYQSVPRYQWTLDIEALRSSPAYVATEFQYLLGFIDQRQGQFDSFLYQDPDDNTVTGQAISLGNGSTSAFQLIRLLGGFNVPVLAPNIINAVKLAGVSIPSGGYSAPTNGALTQTPSGSLSARTYFVKSTWVTNSGETLASAETTRAVSANNVLQVASPSSTPPAGAIGWNNYVSDSTGGGSGAETRQNGTPIPVGNTWQEPNTGLIAGAALPSANTTGWSVQSWPGTGTVSGGTLTFAGSVVNGVAITADFTYYWPCRFLQDSFDFELTYNQLYKLKKLAWTSVKN